MNNQTGTQLEEINNYRNRAEIIVNYYEKHPGRLSTKNKNCLIKLKNDFQSLIEDSPDYGYNDIDGALSILNTINRITYQK